MTETTNTTPTETQETVISKRAENKGRKKIQEMAKTLERLEVNYVPVDGVVPNPYNPNRQTEHDFELLLRSMEEDGFTQPLLVTTGCAVVDGEMVDGADGLPIIVDGEHRWRAAVALNITHIPIVETKMTQTQMRVATIRHNRARGSHDIELEAEVLRDLQTLGAMDWAQESLMIDDVELNRLLEDIQAPDMHANEEFSNAWVPTKEAPTDGESTKARDFETQEGATIRSGASVRALEAEQKKEKALAEAKTDEDRQKAIAESRVFRLNLIFSGEEGEMVKRVLGDEPAVKLVELCELHDEAGAN